MSAITSALSANDRRLRLTGRVTLATGVQRALAAGEILSLTVTEGAQGALMPGDVLSAAYVLKVDSGIDFGGEAALMGATVSLSLGVLLPGGEWGESPLGAFVVGGAKRPEGEAVLTLSGSDSIETELSGALCDALSYPATLNQIWAHLVGQTRYEFSGDVPSGGSIVDARPDWQGISLRRAMGIIAAAAGCFVAVDRAGALVLKRVWDAQAQPFSVESSAYWEMVPGGGSFGPVNRLVVSAKKNAAGQEADVTVRTDAGTPDSVNNTLTIRDNPLFVTGAAHLSALAAGALAQVSGMRLTAMSFSHRGDPALGVGDRVLVTDTAGTARVSVLSGQTLIFDMGFSARCALSVPEVGSGGFMRAITPEGGVNAERLVGTVDGALIAASTVTARTIAAGSVTAEKLAAGAVDAQAVSAVTARLENVTAGTLFADSLCAALANVMALRVNAIDADSVGADTLYAGLAEAMRLAVGSVTSDNIQTDQLAASLGEFVRLYAQAAGLDYAAVKDLVSGTAIITTGEADELYIARLYVTAANIAHLAVGELLLTGADGNLYALTVDDTGEVSATRRQIAGDDLEDSGIDASTKLLAGSVTADRLNVSQIFASSALINAVKAANIDAADLFASDAFIASLNAWDIWANDYMRLTVRKPDMEAWLRIDPEAGVEIGRSDSPVRNVIDNAGWRITDSGQTTADCHDSALWISEGEFTGSLKIGNFAFKPRSDGGFTLLKR